MPAYNDRVFMEQNLKIHVQNLIYICVPEFQRCLTLLDTVSVPFGRLALLILAAFCRTKGKKKYADICLKNPNI